MTPEQQIEKLIADQARRIADLEAALREIAKPTYGTEIHDTDAERAEMYWRQILGFQSVARKVLGQGGPDKAET